jgi:hypothetical protein
MKFRKIAAVLAGAVMLTSTVALAAAANYPAPFVNNGSADVAIVYGSNAANTDLVAALEINSDLTSKLAAQTASGGSSAGSSSVSGGDSYKLEKTSTKFHLGDSAVEDVVSAQVTDNNLPVLLADGVFTDDDNDEFDYTQTITLDNNINVTMFEDNDYKAKTPTVGIKIPNGANILDYTLDFTDQPEWGDLTTANLPILGKSYYVLSNTSDSLTLLDSANTVTIAEGETQSVVVGSKTYSVGISFIGSDSVKLIVDGATTNTLNEGETQKLSDGSYVGVKDILYVSKDTGISKVEISLGKGKLLLQNASEVELNEESISGLDVTIVKSGTKLDQITLSWDADDDLFATTDSSILMPGFEVVKLSFGGLNYPKQEKITIEADGDESVVLSDFPLKDSTEDINVLYTDGTNYTGTGKDSDSKLILSSTSSLSFDGDTDDWFVVSWNDTEDSESYLLRATNWKNESGTQKVTVQQRKNGAWVDVQTDVQDNDHVTIGSAELHVDDPVKASKTVSFTAVGNEKFNVLYSKEGMRVNLPWVNTTARSILNTTGYTAVQACAVAGLSTGTYGLAYNQVVTYNSTSNVTSTVTCENFPATYALVLGEEDKDGTLATGNVITATVGLDSSSDVQLSSVDMGTNEGTFTEQGDTDVFRNFAYSELATEAIWDKSGDSDTPLTLTYHGGESTADVYVSSPSTVVTLGASSSSGGTVTALGSVAVSDAEVSSVSGKNLVVIGGNCVNSVAAKLLGTTGASCGADFETKTGVVGGQFLIETLASPYSASKVATLVAGRYAADTTNAAKYLTTQTVDTTSGKKYKGTSATVATLVTTTA